MMAVLLLLLLNYYCGVMGGLDDLSDLSGQCVLGGLVDLGGLCDLCSVSSLGGLGDLFGLAELGGLSGLRNMDGPCDF